MWVDERIGIGDKMESNPLYLKYSDTGQEKKQKKRSVGPGERER